MNRVITVLIIGVLVASAAMPQTPRDARYPAHWFAPIVDPKKP
jgi:hypothetical protein